VKFGKEPTVTIAEGQCPWALRHIFPQLPVPEIYGWTTDGDTVFLYMELELVQGVTLEERWDSLPTTERVGICQELRAMLADLRRLRQYPSDYLRGKYSSLS